jgi:glutamate---cysteine ligase / carboxylate-amine ligase
VSERGRKTPGSVKTRIAGQVSGVADPANLRRLFEREPDAPMTVGLEEELMLLDPTTHDLAPRARDVLERLDGDPRFVPEMPAAQLEIVGPPAATVGEAAAAIRAARADLAAGADGLARLAGAGVHPFAAAEGVLMRGERYEAILAEYGPVARRQLVFGLHVHVAVGGADRALAVFNALRGHLPELAALGANAPFYEGVDTGLASMRPKLCDILPRQGVPPAIGSWEELAAAFAWAQRAGTMADASQWWYEARLHPRHGTVEVRVPDTQATVAETAALAAVVHALVGRLAERFDAGERLPCPATWRVAENRWSACRHGLDGQLADLETGDSQPTRERLAALLDELGPAAQRLGCAAELAAARGLVDANGAQRQRAVAAERGVTGVAAWLADRFTG